MINNADLVFCKFALLLVSHDRRFLDTVTNRTVEVMLGHIHDYKVPKSLRNIFFFPKDRMKAA